ncbi:MAG: MipA/OmpV family protein [Geminicoccaceae bacterium]|nr:MipA/OmpV family protein [Geminicoccaceae bacterium]
MRRLISFLFLLAAPPALAQTEKPLWEAGVGGVAAWSPDYPASAQNHWNVIPFPFVIYRGDSVEVTERGRLRGYLFDTDRFELDVSAAGAFAADSKDNDARRGMPDLDFLGEIGPRLGVTLHDGPARLIRLDLQARAVFSTDLRHFGFEGFVLNPELVWRERPLLGFKGVEAEFRLGPLVADRRLQGYFYGVDPRYARPGRPAYGADAGYLGTQSSLTLRLPLTDRARLSAGLNAGWFKGASNEGSPLYRDDVNWGASLAVLVSLYQSGRTTRAATDD